jgi:hypothetical protein
MSHVLLRLREHMASVMHNFNKEIDRKNRIFHTKMDILKTIFA